MRVTKTIREYIEKEVSIRIAPKYAAEEAEAKRQFNAKEEILNACSDAAKKAFNACFDEMFPAVADFAEDNRNDVMLSFYNSRTIDIKDRCYNSSVHNWHRRKNEEVKKLVDEIVVTLELGGTKAELMEMLDKIGVGE